MTELTLPLTLAGLALAFGGFAGAARLADAVGWPAEGVVSHLPKWGVAGAVVAFVLVVEGRPLASVGVAWEGPLWFAYWTAVGLAMMLGANVVTQPLWDRVGGGEELAEGLGSFASLSTGERLFVATTAGVTEEVPYRGYAIERVAALTGSPLAAGVVSVVAFTLAHRGDTWGWGAVARIAQPAVVVTGLYLATRSLPVVVAVHALNDAVGLLLADRYADS